MTNFDLIRNRSIEETAKEIFCNDPKSDEICRWSQIRNNGKCPAGEDYAEPENCMQCILDYLNAEVEENNRKDKHMANRYLIVIPPHKEPYIKSFNNPEKARSIIASKTEGAQVKNLQEISLNVKPCSFPLKAKRRKRFRSMLLQLFLLGQKIRKRFTVMQ